MYPDPVSGYPPVYARDSLPDVKVYPDGFEVPRLKDALPGTLLGCVSGGLGLQPYLSSRGDTYVVTSDKEGPDSALDAELADADVLITTPFWPAYVDAARLGRAEKLKLLLTAGVGSDHIDLAAAAAKGVTVAEATHSNSVSVAEHAVMTILTLVRNFVPSHLTAVTGGWHVADLAARSYGACASPRFGCLAVVCFCSRLCMRHPSGSPQTWSAWRSGPWARAASAWRCCAGLRPLTWSCITPTAAACRAAWSRL